MKDISYRCNLCLEGKGLNEVIGIHFVGHGFELRQQSECETHICSKCVAAIQSQLSKMVAMTTLTHHATKE